MFTDPVDGLAEIRERGLRLRAEATAERLRGPSWPRRVLAASLRHAADRLDPAPRARVALAAERAR